MSKRRAPTLDVPSTGRRAAKAGSLGRAARAPTVAGPDRSIRETADAVVEACCLVAILSLPLYFNVLTSTSYEPDKAALLRVYATLAAGAWLIGELVDRKPLRISVRPNVLLLLGAGLFLAYALSTVLSIDSRLSLFGIRTRQDGLITRACYLIFFVCASTRLVRLQQWERLVTVLVFGSIPAVAYGLVQQLGLDPIPQSGDPFTIAWPVRSALGQHIFFASYLAMVIPFTAARSLQNWDWSSAPMTRRDGDEGLLAGMSAAFAAGTFLAFISIGWRRPALFALLPAVLAGYVLLGLLVEELPDSRAVRQVRSLGYGGLLLVQIAALAMTGARAAVIGCIAGTLVFAFLLARRLRQTQLARGILAVVAASALFLVLLNVPGGPLQPLRTMHGFNRLADITDAGGSTGSGQGRLLVWQGIGRLMTHDPAIGGRWGGPGRDVVGYGPETLQWAFQSVFPLELRRVTSENWFWDRAHNIYLDALVDAGLLGLGIFLSVLAVFFWKALRALRDVSGREAWILVAVMSAVGAHLVDGLLAVDITATLLILWLSLGFVVGRREATLAALSPLRGPTHLRATLWYWLGLSLLLVLVSLLPGLTDHLSLLAALWLVAASVGVAAVTSTLRGGSDPELEALRTAPRRHVALPRPSMGWKMTGPSLIALAVALVLAAQVQWQTGSMAEASATASVAVGQRTDAIRYLQASVAANGYEPDYERDLGRLYTQLAAAISSAAPSSSSAAPGVDARTVDPERAITLDRGQLFQLGADSLNRARSLAPLNPDSYDDLGNLYLVWDRPVQAAAEFGRAKQLSLDNPRYIDEQALANLQAHRSTVARRQAERALRLDDGFWYSHYALARIYDRLHLRPAARDQAVEALAWEKNAWPAPPPSQLDELRSLQRRG